MTGRVKSGTDPCQGWRMAHRAGTNPVLQTFYLQAVISIAQVASEPLYGWQRATPRGSFKELLMFRTLAAALVASLMLSVAPVAASERPSEPVAPSAAVAA